MRLLLGSVICMVSSTWAVAQVPSDWNPRLAAGYLDARQQAWFEWSIAKINGGPCISCHTPVPYLLARPALRRILGESQATRWEAALQETMRARLGQTSGKAMSAHFAREPRASWLAGAESVFAALFLSDESKQALDRLWALQIPEGDARGAWPWFDVALEPYEAPQSVFYGAAMAAVAIGNAPQAYRQDPSVQQHLASLFAYFARERDSQPLHHKLYLLWASARLPEAMPQATRQSLIAETWRRQQPDGGWPMESLGPWQTHGRLENSSVSNSYATALVSFTLQKAGVSPSDARLARALAWLRTRQDKSGGYWAADSMNKTYPTASMPENFMRDAATAFASLALAEAMPSRK